MVMMAMLKGNPLISLDGFLATEPRKPEKLSPRVFVKSAISAVPTIVVVIQVRTKRTTLIQGNGRGGASANNSTGGVKVLSMKLLKTKSCDELQRLQVLTGLESHCLSGRDVHFGS